MISQTAIDTAVRRIAASTRPSPSKIILFGSHARGTQTPDSDLDFLVVERRIPSKIKEMARLREAVGNIGLAVDILVCSEEEVAEWDAQQAVEKCLKAVLARHEISFRKVHDLHALIDLLADHKLPVPPRLIPWPSPSS